MDPTTVKQKVDSHEDKVNKDKKRKNNSPGARGEPKKHRTVTNNTVNNDAMQDLSADSDSEIDELTNNPANNTVMSVATIKGEDSTNSIEIWDNSVSVTSSPNNGTSLETSFETTQESNEDNEETLNQSSSSTSEDSMVDTSHLKNPEDNTPMSLIDLEEKTTNKE